MTAAPVRCDRCHRSVWLCPGGDGCSTRPDDIHADEPPCSQLSHDQAKSARPPTLLYTGVQVNDDNEPVLVLLECSRCHSTLGVTPDQWRSSAKQPPRLEVARDERPTLEIPRETLAEIAAAEHLRLGI